MIPPMSNPKRFVSAAVCFCLAWLSGCGGGGDSTPDPSTGTLEAGRVSGLHFETPTQSGTTDANGTFAYLPGETVAFSIGGVQLGAAPGVAKISLFTLAGLTPPSTERVLRRELERATRSATPLVRAMNLARLLIALDVDSNPDNGIDLRGRESDLAGKQIDLGLGLNAFTDKLDRLAPNLTRNIPAARTLLFAYQASSLSVATHAPARYEVSPASSFALSSTITYFPNGARASEQPDPSMSGFNFSTITYTWDPLGRPLTTNFETRLEPAQIYSASLYINIYDARGNQVETVFEQRLLGTLAWRTAYGGAADGLGRIPVWTSTVDFNGDGVNDYTDIRRSTFDARGNALASTTSSDTNGDGVVDFRSSFVDTFDANDRLLTEIYETDSNVDGVADQRNTITLENAGPNVVVRTELVDVDADGVADHRLTWRQEIDRARNENVASIVTVHLPDGRLESDTEYIMTYDHDNRLLTRVVTDDYDGDGIVNRSESSAYEYDGEGSLISATFEQADTFFGNSTRSSTHYSYGADGERTASVTRTDSDADGVFDNEITTQITNQEFSDGVLALAQQYFNFAASTVLVGGGAAST